MGCSNSSYNCCGKDSLNVKEKDINIAKKYISFKNTLKKIKEKKESSLNDIYLVKAKSIPIFIKLIEDPEVLIDINTNNNDEKTFIEDIYERKNENNGIDKDIIIYNSYQDCIKIIEKNDENEFIIVEKDFIELINNKLINNKVALNAYTQTIKFNSKNLEIKEKRTGIYEFVKEKESKIQDNFNPKTELNGEYI